MNGCCDWRFMRSRYYTIAGVCGAPAVTKIGDREFCQKHNPEARARYAANAVAKKDGPSSPPQQQGPDGPL